MNENLAAELASVNRALVHEIVKHKHTEEALRHAEDQYRAVVEESATGIYQITPQFKFLRANPAMAALLGYDSAAQLLSVVTNAADQHNIDPLRPAEFLRLMSEYGRVIDFEVQLRRRDNSLVWVSTTARVARSAIRNEIYFEGIAYDITARKQAEHLLHELPRRILEAQEFERRRVSRELHDGVNQLLASVRFRVQSIETRLSAGDGAAAELAGAKALLENAMNEVRRISHNLRPAELDDFGLFPAINSACDEFRQRTRGRIHLELPDDPPRFPVEIELHLYRIFQEALTNVEKHARAKRVTVRIACTPKIVQLSVKDDGCGLATQSSSGLGLLNMQERVNSVCGQFSLKSVPDTGTELHVEIPLP